MVPVLRTALQVVFFAVKKDFHICWVVQVLDQRCIGEHCLKHPVHGVVAGFPTMPTAHASKKPLEDIIGTLGIDRVSSENQVPAHALARNGLEISIKTLLKRLASSDRNRK